MRWTKRVTAWRSRRWRALWPIVYFDGIVVHARASGRVSPHTIYVALGVNLEGKKELLGLWAGGKRGGEVLVACVDRHEEPGLNDIFVACVDGLAGFPK